MVHDLIRIARQAITNHIHNTEVKEDRSYPQGQACFVSLHKHGELRGCIGYMHSKLPLSKAVQEAAVAAAFHDPRFEPLSREELPHIRIEVSVLSEPYLLEYADEASILDSIIPGKHGVIVSKGFRSGVLLPQVFEESMTAEEMLDMTCQKASLPRGAWKNPSVSIHLFTAQVLSE